MNRSAQAIRDFVAPAIIQCDGKTAFLTWGAANARSSRDAAPYRCPHCHHWHVGHAMKSEGRPRRPYVAEDGIED